VRLRIKAHGIYCLLFYRYSEHGSPIRLGPRVLRNSYRYQTITPAAAASGR
jgi:hypothetical protein